MLVSAGYERVRTRRVHGRDIGRGVRMKRLSPAVIAAILAALASTAAAAAQPRGIMPRLQSHVANPSQSLSAPASNPLQSQMQNDYATDLRAAQRDLLQQNPSGLSRQEMAIGHELNSYGGPR